MANASVEKIKALGLRHGEKAVVGLAAALCVLFLVTAATKPTIKLTPDQVNQATKAAETNLNRRQEPDDILARLEEAGIKNPAFEKQVDEQTKNLLVAANYRVRNPWVTPEPGAGLIRDMPELIAVSELYAYPGRGGALVFALDDNGDRIPDEGKKDDATATARRRRKRRAPAAGGAMASAPRRKARRNPAEAEKEQLAEHERKQERQRKLVAGGKEEPKEKEEPEPAMATDGPKKEITQGLRWVVITGALDYKKLRDNYLAALKLSTIAFPNFDKLEVERQTLNADGTWSDWEPIDREQNDRILTNLPEVEEELTPDTVRIDLLVDPLPFLKAGYWERVHIASLVPKEKIELEKPKPVAAGSGPGGSSSSAMSSMMANAAADEAARNSSSPMMSSSPGMMAGGGAEGTNFQTTEADTIMIRALDFTVEPDQSYHYRVRIVVYNPNKDREDVSPGIDNKSPELFGPWSEPTETVTMPADVATYAMHKTLSAGKRTDQVHFQVARWTPEDGVTVVREFDAGPGEVVGDYISAQIPNTDGEKATSKRTDFNSRRIVLDTEGGRQLLPPGVTGAPLDVPALSLVLRPDGSVVVQSQPDDLADDVRTDTESNYKRELKESGKKRESSLGSGSGGARRRRRR